MSHHGAQLQDGQSAGFQCQLARTGGPQLPQSVQSVPAAQFPGSLHPCILLYGQESSGGDGRRSSMQPLPSLPSPAPSPPPPSHLCWIGQLHSPLLSGPIAGGAHLDGSHMEQLHVGHCTQKGGLSSDAVDEISWLRGGGERMKTSHRHTNTRIARTLTSSGFH